MNKHLFSELANYCIIYQFLVEHDKTMSLVLSENAIKTRMKKNVVTLAGHTTTFSVKLAILLYHIEKSVPSMISFLICSFSGTNTMGNGFGTTSGKQEKQLG